MLTRNTNCNKIVKKQNKTKLLNKRRYSEITETSSSHEPVRKLRKLKSTRLEKDENNVDDIIVDDVIDKSGSDFKDFIKYFSIPSNIYKCLSVRHKSNPILLKRCLSYNRDASQYELSRSNIQSIADHLSMVRFHDENISLMKGKLQNSIKVHQPKKIVLKFGSFIDNKTQKDWETVEASIYVDIVHFHRDNRKNKEGFFSSRIVSNQRVLCNKSGIDGGDTHTIDISEIMIGVRNYRVHKSLIHFKILAKEKKLYLKNISDGRRSEEMYPVTYEAMIPLFNSRDKLQFSSNTFFLQDGKYEIFPRVTNMEKCDDSMFSGVMQNEYNPDGEKINSLDFHWIKIDDIQSINANRNNAKFIFTISNDETPKPVTTPLKIQNNSLPPITKLSPTANGDLYLTSKRMEVNSKFEVSVAFKFLVQDNIVQWTKTSHLTCPWCQLHFRMFVDLFTTLTNMMKHLNSMHPKFTFTCKKLASASSFKKSVTKRSVTIDVSLTPVGPIDWDLGLKLIEKLPAKRMQLSEVIYTKNQPTIPNLYRPHHRRDYCHTWSSRKNKYIEFDIDSESEENMGWLFDHYARKVEEFSDLNHMEKRVIQMWNDSLLKYGLSIGDLQMKSFIEHFVVDIIEHKDKLAEIKRARNTLMLHLVNLIDFGLLPPTVMLRCMKSLDVAIDAPATV